MLEKNDGPYTEFDRVPKQDFWRTGELSSEIEKLQRQVTRLERMCGALLVLVKANQEQLKSLAEKRDVEVTEAGKTVVIRM